MMIVPWILFFVLLYVVLQIFFGLSIEQKKPFSTELSLDSLEDYINSSEDSLGIDVLHKKEIVWHNKKQKTPVALVYVHGFVADKHEIRPVPNLLAEKLKANTFYTRLTGHGQDNKALENMTFADWVYDVQEAINIGKTIGEKVLLVSTSTGGTLISHVLTNSDIKKDILGSIFVSPNFKLKNPLSSLLFVPFSKQIALLIKGKTTGSTDGVKKQWLLHWNFKYPTVALLPMATAIKAVRKDKHKIKNIGIPALFIYSVKDAVVRYQNILKMAKLWGAETYEVKIRDGMDPHVITGNLRSPQSVDEVTGVMYKHVASWL